MSIASMLFGIFYAFFFLSLGIYLGIKVQKIKTDAFNFWLMEALNKELGNVKMKQVLENIGKDLKQKINT